ncbi:MAG TPA: zinc dependent phospholipase C family protein, partial [Chloroflexota bacterium]|nr:zinc dependent phospholipase C family protein [Chloroflexota bacterium]
PESVPWTYIHLWIAKDVASAMAQRGRGRDSAHAADGDSGNAMDARDEMAVAGFFFGAIAPDVGLLVGTPRAKTHYWAPGDDASGWVGASRLPTAHPHLGSYRLSNTERAFVAGYLCHLATDEQWIRTIYERYFGPQTRYAAGPEGSALQQALYTLVERRHSTPVANGGDRGDGDEPATERGAVADHPWVATLTQALQLPLHEDLLPFTAADDLRRFLDAQLALAAVPVGAERYRLWTHLRAGFAASTAQSPSPPASTMIEARLMERLPELEAQVAELVQNADLERLHRRAVSEGTELLRKYLASCPV